MSANSTYEEAVRLFCRTAVQPTVSVVSTLEDGVCAASECRKGPDLRITFIGEGNTHSNAHLRCLEHWGAAWLILTNAGCEIDYSMRALEWIMCQ